MNGIKKLIILIFMCFCSCSYSQVDFSDKYESEHFLFHFNASDREGVDQLLHHLNSHFNGLSQDFKHNYRNKIQVYVFSSIQDFHEQIKKPNGPAWAVACEQAEMPGFLIVSPTNPGSFHTCETILKVGIVNLTKLFIADKYKHNIPYWLKIGVAYLKADMPKENTINRIMQTLKNKESIPDLSQLSIFDRDSFPQIGGFQYSYAYVLYINSRWGWNTLLELLERPEELEQILGLSQAEFKKQWIESWQ